MHQTAPPAFALSAVASLSKHNVAAAAIVHDTEHISAAALASTNQDLRDAG